MGCIFVGLVISIPFAWTHEAVEPITWNSQDWIGEIDDGYYWYYADYMILLTFGGIPWQVCNCSTYVSYRKTFYLYRVQFSTTAIWM